MRNRPCRGAQPIRRVSASYHYPAATSPAIRVASRRAPGRFDDDHRLAAAARRLDPDLDAREAAVAPVAPNELGERLGAGQGRPVASRFRHGRSGHAATGRSPAASAGSGSGTTVAAPSVCCTAAAGGNSRGTSSARRSQRRRIGNHLRIGPAMAGPPIIGCRPDRAKRAGRRGTKLEADYQADYQQAVHVAPSRLATTLRRSYREGVKG
jgi:hypothetical protein